MVKNINDYLSVLPWDEQVRVRRKIREYTNECGCALGGWFLLIAAITYVTVIMLGGLTFAWSFLFLKGLNLFGIAILAAVMGKVIGISWAKLKLKRLYRMIKMTQGNSSARAII